MISPRLLNNILQMRTISSIFKDLMKSSQPNTNNSSLTNNNSINAQNFTKLEPIAKINTLTFENSHLSVLKSNYLSEQNKTKFKSSRMFVSNFKGKKNPEKLQTTILNKNYENSLIEIENFVFFIETHLELSARELLYLNIRSFINIVKTHNLNLKTRAFRIEEQNLEKKLKIIIEKRTVDQSIIKSMSNINWLDFPSFEEIHKIRLQVQHESSNQNTELNKFLCLISEKAIETELTQNNSEHDKNDDLKIHEFFKNEDNQHFEQEENFSETSWVYIYGLPYDLSDSRVLNQLIDRISNYGEVKIAQFFKFKDFKEQVKYERLVFERKDDEKFISVMEKMTGKRFQVEIINPNERLIEKLSEEKLTNSLKNEKNALESENDHKNAIESENNHKNEKKTIQKKSLFEQLNTKANSNFDKSYLLLKFDDLKSKRDFLDNNMRVFGLTLGKLSVKFEDADYKRVIKITNFPLNISVGEIFEPINAAFIKHDIEPFKFDTTNPHKIVNFRSIILTFPNFETSLKALNILTDLKINNRCLKAYHNYGGTYFIDGRFVELYSKKFEVQRHKIINDNKTQIKNSNFLRDELISGEIIFKNLVAMKSFKIVDFIF